MHRFIHNNPLSFVDPYGLWSFFRWIYTGDGDAPDDVYDGALDEAADWVDKSADCIQTGLDAVGVVDPTGAADGINASLFGLRGDAANAAISATSMLPGGDAAKASKYGKKALDKAKDLADAAKKKKSCPNPDGQVGKADHRATVDELGEKARAEYPDDIVHSGTSIKDKTGVNRRPDQWVEDAQTGEVKKVYEAARQNKDGTFVSRERRKADDYDSAGIPAEFEGVK